MAGQQTPKGASHITIERLQVLDALQGTPIDGYRFRTESGALYNFVGGTMVREPVTGSFTALASSTTVL